MKPLRLTRKQFNECPVWDTWSKSYLEVHKPKESDPEQATSHICRLYAAMKLPEPRFILETHSPVGSVLLIKYLHKFETRKNYREMTLFKDSLSEEGRKVMRDYFTLDPLLSNPYDIYPTSWLPYFKSVGVPTFSYFAEQCKKKNYPTRGIPINVRLNRKFKRLLVDELSCIEYIRGLYPDTMFSTVTDIMHGDLGFTGKVRPYLHDTDRATSVYYDGVRAIGDGMCSEYASNAPFGYTLELLFDILLHYGLTCEPDDKDYPLYAAWKSITSLQYIYGDMFFFNDTVILERPCTAKHLRDKVYHNETGPAIQWGDGLGIYAVNGVLCPDWLIETKSEDLDPKKLFEIDNTEVRREFVRKVGVERLLYKLGGNLIDEDGPYELYEMIIPATTSSRRSEHRIRALKMSNPSVEEVWHVEFVHPRCSTVQSALNFRNNLTTTKIDDVNGADWYQQGDVILRPKGAKKYKSRPIILT